MVVGMAIKTSVHRQCKNARRLPRGPSSTQRTRLAAIRASDGRARLPIILENSTDPFLPNLLAYSAQILSYVPSTRKL